MNYEGRSSFCLHPLAFIIYPLDSPYHRQILTRAIGARISSRALEVMITGNLDQDSLPNLLRHPEYHFDDNLFAESLASIEDFRQQAARAGQPRQAWEAFGRLTHIAQDFYAHSNYVALWMAQAPSSTPPIESIDGLDPTLLKHPRLVSGKVYFFQEALCYIPGLRPFVKKFAPADSHLAMNLDTPDTGPLFPYALEAATQRTLAEFERTLAFIGEEQGAEAMRAFLDK